MNYREKLLCWLFFYAWLLCIAFIRARHYYGF